MLVVEIVSWICLGILALEVLSVIFSILLKKHRSERIERLRSFKRGKCALIYVVALPLYFMGFVYAGEDMLYAFFKSISKMISLVVLSYDTSGINKLMGDSDIYEIAIYTCFVLVCLNAIVFTLSLFSQYLWMGIRRIRVSLRFGDKLFVIGNNKESVAIYKSEKRRCRVILDNISSDDGTSLYMKDISYISTRTDKDALSLIFGQAGRFRRECVIVINTGDDKRNINICHRVIDRIDSVRPKLKDKMFLKLKVYVFGDPRYETVYANIVSEAYGCIHYVNKYEKLAVDFIDSYPISAFMDERHIDYATSYVKEGVNINVVMIGFGRTNQQIFLTSVANNQFISAGDGEPSLKKVRYHIFDKDPAENNKNLNHSYYRFRHECADLKREDYLPMPSLPAEEFYYHLDINSPEFYSRIREVVDRSERDVNALVIAFGSDLENIDMAQKLIAKRSEWGIDNLVIFVKVRGWRKSDTLIKDPNCYFIGNEAEDIYDINVLTSDKLTAMAQMRNETYDLEFIIKDKKAKGKTVTKEEIDNNHDASISSWYKNLSELERKSSLYCCLSLRSKLHLMGLDYCPKDGVDGMDYDAYIKHYAGGDKPDIDTYNEKANDKPIVNYTLDFKASRRRDLAIHEHLRWNSFMISNGMVPASIDDILTEPKHDKDGNIVYGKDGKPKFGNGKNYAVRHHGNLTTFAGLVKFRRLVAERDKSDEESCDVIKYDYQLLDDAVWLLEKNGFKIVKKN